MITWLTVPTDSVGGDGDTAGALLSPQLLAQLKRDLPLNVTDALLSQVQDALKVRRPAQMRRCFSTAR